MCGRWVVIFSFVGYSFGHGFGVHKQTHTKKRMTTHSSGNYQKIVTFSWKIFTMLFWPFRKKFWYRFCQRINRTIVSYFFHPTRQCYEIIPWKPTLTAASPLSRSQRPQPAICCKTIPERIAVPLKLLAELWKLRTSFPKGDSITACDLHSRLLDFV